MILAARALSALALVMVVGVGIAVVRYESARDAWRVHGTAIGTPDYDAAASDAAYREVESALTWVERAARASAACLVIAGAAIGRAARRRERGESTRGRRIAARGIDLALLVLALATSRLRVSSPGVTEALAWLVPAIVIACSVGAAVNGASVGQRVTRA